VRIVKNVLNHLFMDWGVPRENGSPLTGYKVEIQHLTAKQCFELYEKVSRKHERKLNAIAAAAVEDASGGSNEVTVDGGDAGGVAGDASDAAATDHRGDSGGSDDVRSGAAAQAGAGDASLAAAETGRSRADSAATDTVTECDSGSESPRQVYYDEGGGRVPTPDGENNQRFYVAEDMAPLDVWEMRPFTNRSLPFVLPAPLRLNLALPTAVGAPPYDITVDGRAVLRKSVLNVVPGQLPAAPPALDDTASVSVAVSTPSLVQHTLQSPVATPTPFGRPKRRGKDSSAAATPAGSAAGAGAVAPAGSVFSPLDAYYSFDGSQSGLGDDADDATQALFAPSRPPGDVAAHMRRMADADVGPTVAHAPPRAIRPGSSSGLVLAAAAATPVLATPAAMSTPGGSVSSDGPASILRTPGSPSRSRALRRGISFKASSGSDADTDGDSSDHGRHSIQPETRRSLTTSLKMASSSPSRSVRWDGVDRSDEDAPTDPPRVSSGSRARPALSVITAAAGDGNGDGDGRSGSAAQAGMRPRSRSHGGGSLSPSERSRPRRRADGRRKSNVTPSHRDRSRSPLSRGLRSRDGDAGSPSHGAFPASPAHAASGDVEGADGLWELVCDTLPETQTALKIEYLTPGMGFRVRVTAKNAWGWGKPSAASAMFRLPTTPEITVATRTSLVVRWPQPFLEYLGPKRTSAVADYCGSGSESEDEDYGLQHALWTPPRDTQYCYKVQYQACLVDEPDGCMLWRPFHRCAAAIMHANVCMRARACECVCARASVFVRVCSCECVRASVSVHGVRYAVPRCDDDVRLRHCWLVSAWYCRQVSRRRQAPSSKPAEADGAAAAARGPGG
jgi:hypothetical protein